MPDNLERVMWEAKMTALTSAVQRAATLGREVDNLSNESIALGLMIAAVTFMRTTRGITPEMEREFINEALRAVPDRSQAPNSGLVLAR